jgi:hypothetical protein
VVPNNRLVGVSTSDLQILTVPGGNQGSSLLLAKDSYGAPLASLLVDVSVLGLGFKAPSLDQTFHLATQRGDYSQVNPDSVTPRLRGPRELLGGRSKGYYRWLEILSGGVLRQVSEPKGQALSASYLRTTYEDESRRILVLRQGFTLRLPGGDVKDFYVEIWWLADDESEFNALSGWAEETSEGQEDIPYAMLSRAWAGDTALYFLMKRDLGVMAVNGAANVAAGALLTRLWRPGVSGGGARRGGSGGTSSSPTATRQLLVPKAIPMRRGRYSGNVQIDRILLERARDLRRTQAGIRPENFRETNVAVARVRINGKIDYLDAGNIRGQDFGASRGLDSEQLILVQIQELRRQGNKVVLEQLYSERIPCLTCTNMLDQEHPTAEVFYTVPERRALDQTRGDALMRAYGLDPDEIKDGATR